MIGTIATDKRLRTNAMLTIEMLDRRSVLEIRTYLFKFGQLIETRCVIIGERDNNNLYYSSLDLNLGISF